MLDKQVIRSYIRKKRETSSASDKNLWHLTLMWTDTRDIPTFEAMVRAHLAEAQKEVKKPYDKNDAFDVNWQEGLERDVRVFGAIVKWMNEQKGADHD